MQHFFFLLLQTSSLNGSLSFLKDFLPFFFLCRKRKRSLKERRAHSFLLKCRERLCLIDREKYVRRCVRQDSFLLFSSGVMFELASCVALVHTKVWLLKLLEQLENLLLL